LPTVDVLARVSQLLDSRPEVVGVALIGSRSRNEATPLSDWDLLIHTTDAPALARELPALVRPLEPLAAQWDRLADHDVYMLVLPGAVKVDLFPGQRPHALDPPWEPTPGNLAAIDAHFWDWVLWLGSKYLHGRRELVQKELHKLHDHLLGPLGVTTVPQTIDEAVLQYCRARDRLEREWGVAVGRELSDDVTLALRRHGVIGAQ
jgi:Nucleotidyltransferase domain